MSIALVGSGSAAVVALCLFTNAVWHPDSVQSLTSGGFHVEPGSIWVNCRILERSLSIRHVYGEPVRHGETTVIPSPESLVALGRAVGNGPSTFRNTQTMTDS